MSLYDRREKRCKNGSGKKWITLNTAMNTFLHNVMNYQLLIIHQAENIDRIWRDDI